MFAIQEYLKYLVPLATFGLGIWATPYIESRKEKAKAKSVQIDLMMEIEDELSELPRRLKKMAETLCNLQRLKAGEPKIGRSLKYVPRNTNFFFLKPAIDSSFRLFNNEQRYALKSLIAQTTAIESYLVSISETTICDEAIDRLINSCKRYLYTACCMLNSLRIIAKKSQANTYEEDSEVIKHIFCELEIALHPNDLVIKETEKFDKIG